MKDIHQIIEQLSPADACATRRVHALATSDEALAGRIAEIALAHFDQIDVEEVSADLYDELDALEVEEVWERAGRKRNGYVETGEAAYQMIEAALTPSGAASVVSHWPPRVDHARPRTRRALPGLCRPGPPGLPAS